MAALCQEDTCTKIKDTNGEVEKDKKKKKKIHWNICVGTVGV